MNQQGIDDTFGKIFNISDIYPLSHLQEGFLSTSLMNNQSGDYVLQSVMNLEGNVKIHNLKLACKKHFKSKNKFYL